MTLPDTNAVDERYEDLGGVYFPMLQQDGTRTMVKVGNGKDQSSFIFLNWLRQHDRLQERPVGKEKPCAGWVANQLGPRNNIGLRMMAIHRLIGNPELIGEKPIAAA